MLGVTCLSVVVVALDLTILNIALPAISAELHASTRDLQWIVDAYSLGFAAVMLPAGLAGDRFGRRRLLLPGLPGRAAPGPSQQPAPAASPPAGARL
jgi:MFS family permease